MAAFNKFNDFIERVALKEHNLHTDTLRVYLSNEQPLATDLVITDIADLGTSNGYTAGGEDTQNTVSEAAGVASVVGVDIVWTASGAGFGPFRFAVLYNDTHASNALVGWWDYGSSISLTVAGETFTTDFGASMFTLG